MAEEELYLTRYWRMPFSTKFVGLFVLAVTPLAILLAIGETISPNEGILDGAAVGFVAVSFIVGIVTSVLARTIFPVGLVYLIDIVAGIFAVVALQVTYKSSSSTSVLVGAVLIMYLLRIHFLYHLKSTTVLGFFHGQLKTDSAVLVAVGFLYTLSILYHQHLMLVLVQLTEIVVFCLLLWTVVLRQLERLERGLQVHVFSHVLSWLYTMLFLSVLSMSAMPGMRNISVVRHKYAAPPPLEIQVHRERQQESILKRLHWHIHAFLTSNTTYWLSVAIFAILIVALGVTLFVVFRKRSPDEPEERALGSLAITERRRIPRQQSLPLLVTTHPLRLQVQSYLQGLLRQGANPGTWRSVRGVERIHRDSKIKSILDEYEQVRYKPPER